VNLTSLPFDAAAIRVFCGITIRAGKFERFEEGTGRVTCWEK
jgi:hypothetical protein